MAKDTVSRPRLKRQRIKRKGRHAKKIMRKSQFCGPRKEDRT